jgi:hypothetical protein
MRFELTTDLPEFDPRRLAEMLRALADRVEDQSEPGFAIVVRLQDNPATCRLRMLDG